jgi:hypothetical protein
LLFYEEKSGDFRLHIRNLEEGGRKLCPQPAMTGRPTPAATKLAWLEP